MPESTIATFTWENLLKPVIGLLLGVLGWNIKQAHKKVEVVEDDIKEFPKSYVMKPDYEKDIDRLIEAIKGVRTEIKDGHQRIHERIDNLSK